jgi:uncharacterized protein YjiS (DUF1127 family)
MPRNRANHGEIAISEHDSSLTTAEAVDANPPGRPAVNPIALNWAVGLPLIRRAGVAVGQSIQLWLDYHRSLQELHRLTDDYLRDLKITRGDISGIAWDEARRRSKEGLAGSTQRKRCEQRPRAR